MAKVCIMPKTSIKKNNLSAKDKSLILFIIVLLIVIWSSISFFSYVADLSKSSSVNLNKIVDSDHNSWINLPKSLEKSDLKNRVIILKFWNYSCASCIQSISNLKKIKEDYGNGVAVLAIHSSIFEHENSLNSIKKAVSRYNVDFPVLADINGAAYREFAVKSLPTYILIDPLGKIYSRYENSSDIDKLTKDISKLVLKYRFRLNKNEIPLSLKKDRLIKTILNSPNRLAYTVNFSTNSEVRPALFISDSGNNSIVATSLDGKILYKVGGNKSGYVDGGFESALFNNPQGMVFNFNKLYVADSGNNAIRVLDFESKSVATIVGSGDLGGVIENSIMPVANIQLNNPLDIEFYPDNNNLLIANSGSNQILTYSFRDKSVKAFVGNGKSGLRDGKSPLLANTSDLYSYQDEVYFIDSRTSSLRKVNKDGEVKTLVGKGLNIFGHKNGDPNQALMQNPTSLTVDDTGAYIVDSFNKVIRRYDFGTKKLSDYKSFKNKVDNNINFDEPSSIVSIADRFYISDSNNSRVVSINRTDYKTALLDIMPAQEIKKGNLVELVTNSTIIKDVTLPKNKKIKVLINPKAGWKINSLGPSYLNLLVMESEEEARLIKSFDWNDVKNNNIELPTLATDNSYILQGFIYFCEDKENSLCYVKDIQRNLIVESKKHSNTIEINLEK